MKLTLIFLLVVASSLFVFVGCKQDEDLPEIPDHEHLYVPIVVEPTCTEDGYTLYKCFCGEEYQEDVVPAIGHDYSITWTYDVSPTCTEEGEMSHHCKNCDAKTDVTKVDKAPHDYFDGACVNCGQKEGGIIEAAGLRYTLSYDGSYYIVTGIGTETATELVIPSIYNGKSVQEIGSSAFKNCRGLKSVTIPNGVTTIGANAFELCFGLESVAIPDGVTTIGEFAFVGCYNLTSITIPSSVTLIGNQAFSECYRLVEIINKSSLNVTKYDYDNGGVGLYSLNIKTKGVSEIVNVDDYLFYTCNGTNYLVSYVGNGTELVLPQNYKGQNYKINQCAFAFRDDLVSVTIGGGVTAIGTGAFGRCMRLTSITIPDNVTLIEYRAFSDCYELTSVTIGKGVTTIDVEAFSGCYKLVEIINKSKVDVTQNVDDKGAIAECALTIKKDGVSDIVNVNDYLFYTYNGVNYLLAYAGNDTRLVLPENYNGQKYEIYKFAFYSRDDITSITIPDSVTAIGGSAFASCNGLTSITISDRVTSN